MSPIFSIVIVHYDASQYLGQCLRSVAHAAGDIPHEIIIVDNASHNGPPPPKTPSACAPPKASARSGPSIRSRRP